jgi:hypothetical protein
MSKKVLIIVGITAVVATTVGIIIYKKKSKPKKDKALIEEDDFFSKENIDVRNKKAGYSWDYRCGVNVPFGKSTSIDSDGSCREVYKDLI